MEYQHQTAFLELVSGGVSDPKDSIGIHNILIQNAQPRSLQPGKASKIDFQDEISLKKHFFSTQLDHPDKYLHS